MRLSTRAALRFLLSDETLRKIEAQRIETRTDLVRQETMLNSLKQMKPDKLVQVLPTTVNDSLLTTLLEQLTMAEQKLVVQSKVYGSQHTEIIQLNDSISDLKKKINARVEGIMSSLDSKVTALRRSLEGLRWRLTQPRLTILPKPTKASLTTTPNATSSNSRSLGRS